MTEEKAGTIITLESGGLREDKTPYYVVPTGFPNRDEYRRGIPGGSPGARKASSKTESHV